MNEREKLVLLGHLQNVTLLAEQCKKILEDPATWDQYQSLNNLNEGRYKLELEAINFSLKISPLVRRAQSRLTKINDQE